MNILENDSINVLGLLASHLQDGDKWMVYDTSAGILSPATMSFYKSFEQANAAAKKSGDGSALPVMPLIPVYSAVSDVLLQAPEGKGAAVAKAARIELDMAALHFVNADEILAQQQVETMLAQAAPYGFTDKLAIDLQFALYVGEPLLIVRQKEQFGADKMTFMLHFKQDNDHNYLFDGYEAYLRKRIDIPRLSIGGVDIGELDLRASQVNWDEQMIESVRPEIAGATSGRLPQNFLNAQKVARQLEELVGTGGVNLANLIRYKHWEDTPNENHIGDLASLKKEYSRSLWVRADKDYKIQPYQAYALLNGRAIGLSSKEGPGVTKWLYPENYKNECRIDYQADVVEDAKVAGLLEKIGLKAKANQPAAALLDYLKGGFQTPALYGFQDKLLDVEVWHGKRGEGFLIKVDRTNQYIQSHNGIIFIGPQGQKPMYHDQGPEVSLSFITHNKSSIMNIENFKQLVDNLKYLGFGEDPALAKQLEEKMKSNEPSFELKREKSFSPGTNLESTLRFRKSDADWVFWNNYTAVLQHAEAPEKNREQTFYITQGKGITQKEAFNLMEGRAVFKTLKNKEGEEYTAWLQLNLNDPKDKKGNYTYNPYYNKYGYNLEQALAKHNIVEMEDPEKKSRLIRSLQRGNLTEATREFKGQHEKVFLEAVPKYKQVAVHKDGAIEREKTEKQGKEQRTTKGENPDEEKKRKTKKDLETEEPGQQKSRSKKK